MSQNETATVAATECGTPRLRGLRRPRDWAEVAHGAKQPQFIFAAVVLAIGGFAAYSYHLGGPALGPSEAYSALAAMQPGVGAVAHSALCFDPGKPVLYHLLLHWFCLWFGAIETSLRAFSLICGLASTALVFLYGCELFSPAVGFAAAAIWTFNPLALLLARWARMYSMFVALALGHLLAMARLRRGATNSRTVAAGLLGAAMLYSHLAAVFIIGADLIVVIRESRRERRSVSWPAPAIAVLLFVPFMPVALAQTRALLFGHWLDWIGVYQGSAAVRLLAAGAAGAALWWLGWSAPQGSEESESVRRCLIYAIVPLLALGAGSIILRPMFAVRYVAPSVAVAAVMLAWALQRGGPRLRNDLVFAIVILWVVLLPLCYAAQAQPWRTIAQRVTAGSSARETIFFESGFFSPARVIAHDESGGFPRGFFSVPFAYYFKGRNSTGAIPGDDPQRSRELIASAVQKAGGAWLISGKQPADAVDELPSGDAFELDFEQDFSRVLLLHVRYVGHRRAIGPALVLRDKGRKPAFVQGVERDSSVEIMCHPASTP